MLNFRLTNIIFGSLLVVLIAFHISSDMPWYAYVLLVFVYSLVVFYGCIYLSADFFIKAYCSAKTDNKEIAISFDDGPAPQHTPAILSILKENNITAAFFCIGNRISGNESILKQLDAEGHLIGNHSNSHHAMFDLFSASKMLADMQTMDNNMQQVTGKRPKLFRPPYGVMNPNLKAAVQKGEYFTVGWSVRSFDTVAKDEQQLLAKVNKGITPGAVFLFHDTCSITLSILPAFIQEVKARGYNIVRLDKMLNLPAYA